MESSEYNVKVFVGGSTYHKRYVHDEKKIIALTRCMDGPLIDETTSDFVFGDGNVVIVNYEHDVSDSEYTNNCLRELNNNMFGEFLSIDANFTIPSQVRNGIDDSSEYDAFFLGYSIYGHHLPPDYVAEFMVVFDNDIPIGSVNIFTTPKFPNHFGFLGIKKSPVSVLTNTYHGVAKSLFNAAYRYMKERKLNIFVVPAPLESMYTILVNEGFALRMDISTNDNTAEFLFMKPICNLSWYYVKTI